MARPGPLAWLGGLLAAAVVPVAICRAWHWRFADVLFGLASGAAASIGMVASKLMMAGSTAGDGGILANLSRWPFWVFVAFMAVGNTGSMIFQQIGFQKGRAIVLAPIFAVCTVVLPALTGVVVFDEWAGLEPWVVWTKSLAIAGIVAGVAILSMASHPRPGRTTRDG